MYIFGKVRRSSSCKECEVLLLALARVMEANQIDVGSLQATVHRLNSLLSQTEGKAVPYIADRTRRGLTVVILPALSTLVAAGNSELVLLCLTSMSHLGERITNELCTDVKVRMTVIAALLASRVDRTILNYALPCAFNLSSGSAMLELLCCEKRIVGLLRNCASTNVAKDKAESFGRTLPNAAPASSSNAEAARTAYFAQGILDNMQLYRDQMQPKLPYGPKQFRISTKVMQQQRRLTQRKRCNSKQGKQQPHAMWDCAGHCCAGHCCRNCKAMVLDRTLREIRVGGQQINYRL